jgi:alpha-beta hydrolase superfamily lysophospholipase
MTARDYRPPNGLRTRGTVIILPGRGETPAVYARLGSRLAYDAYRVRVTDLPGTDPADVVAFRRELAQQLAREVEDIGDELVRPLVLLGSDLGAAGIAALLADVVPDAVWWPQAAVLAALPGYRARHDGSWEDELNIRTHCPTHRGVLADTAAVQHGRLAAVVPDELLDAAYQSTADVPQLLLAGEADPLADRDAIARAAKALPAARLAVVRGGHHDVLNNLQHRSVAAEIVAFLEALRDDLTLAITIETSTW